MLLVLSTIGIMVLRHWFFEVFIIMLLNSKKGFNKIIKFLKGIIKIKG